MQEEEAGIFFSGSETLSLPEESAPAQRVAYPHGFRGIKRISFDRKEGLDPDIDLLLSPSSFLEGTQKLGGSNGSGSEIKRLRFEKHGAFGREVLLGSDSGLGLGMGFDPDADPDPDLDLEPELTSNRTIDKKWLEQMPFANLLKLLSMFDLPLQSISEEDLSNALLTHTESGECSPWKPGLGLQWFPSMDSFNLRNTRNILDMGVSRDRFDHMISSTQNQHPFYIAQNGHTISSLEPNNNREFVMVFAGSTRSDYVGKLSQTHNLMYLYEDVDCRDVTMKLHHCGFRRFCNVKKPSRDRCSSRNSDNEDVAMVEGLLMEPQCRFSQCFDYAKQPNQGKNMNGDADNEYVTLVKSLEIDLPFGVSGFDDITKSDQETMSHVTVRTEGLAVFKDLDKELQSRGPSMQNLDSNVNQGLAMETETVEAWRFGSVDKPCQAVARRDSHGDMKSEDETMLGGAVIDSESSCAKKSKGHISFEADTTTDGNCMSPNMNPSSDTTSTGKTLWKRCCWAQENPIHCRNCTDDTQWTCSKESSDRHTRGKSGHCRLHSALLEDRRVHGSATFEGVGTRKCELFSKPICSEESFLSSIKSIEHCDDCKDRVSHNSFDGCNALTDCENSSYSDDLMDNKECILSTVGIGEKDRMIQKDMIFSSDTGISCQMLSYDSSNGALHEQEGSPTTGSVSTSCLSSGHRFGSQPKHRHVSQGKMLEFSPEHKAKKQADDESIFDMSSLDLPDERVHGGNIMLLLSERLGLKNS